MIGSPVLDIVVKALVAVISLCVWVGSLVFFTPVIAHILVIEINLHSKVYTGILKWVRYRS